MYTDVVPDAVDENRTFFPHYQPVVEHPYVMCDVCNKPVKGSRYKCGNCPNFDLCELCEQTSLYQHCSDHVFVKIKIPTSMAGKTTEGRCVPMLSQNVYRQNAPSHPYSQNNDTTGEELQPVGNAAYYYVYPMPPAPLSISWEFEQVFPILPDDLGYVTAAQIFLQTWTLLNNSPQQWRHGLVLKHVKGAVKEDPHVLVPNTVPALHPGESCQIHLQLQAPLRLGYHESEWAVSDLDEKHLICGVWVEQGNRPFVPVYPHRPLDLCYSPGVDSEYTYYDDDDDYPSRSTGDEQNSRDGESDKSPSKSEGSSAGALGDKQDGDKEDSNTERPASLPSPDVPKSSCEGIADANAADKDAQTDTEEDSPSVDILSDSDIDDLCMVGSSKQAVSYRHGEYDYGDITSSSDDDDDDFIMVPLPSCFELPTSLNVDEDEFDIDVVPLDEIEPAALIDLNPDEGLASEVKSDGDLTEENKPDKGLKDEEKQGGYVEANLKPDEIVGDNMKQDEDLRNDVKPDGGLGNEANANGDEKSTVAVIKRKKKVACKTGAQLCHSTPTCHSRVHAPRSDTAAPFELLSTTSITYFDISSVMGGSALPAAFSTAATASATVSNSPNGAMLADTADGASGAAGGGSAAADFVAASHSPNDAILAEGASGAAGGGLESAEDKSVVDGAQAEVELPDKADEVKEAPLCPDKASETNSSELTDVQASTTDIASRGASATNGDESQDVDDPLSADIIEEAMSKLFEASQGVARNIMNFFTEQDEYEPPRSSWTPSSTSWKPASGWTPPSTRYAPSPSQDNWTTPPDDYVPPRSQWTPLNLKKKGKGSTDDVTHV